MTIELTASDKLASHIWRLKNMSSSLSTRLSIALVTALVSVSSFSATVSRTFVSGQQGSDANDCLLATPCRTFSKAITQTTSGGEIVVLDSAGYGAFTIDRNVTIVSPLGVHAGITATTGDAITINGSGAIVSLRNLTISGLGASNGINDQTSSKLYMENCEISKFLNAGLVYTNGSNWSGGNLVDVSHSVFRDNFYGIRMNAGGAFYIYTEVDQSLFASNHYGIIVQGDGFNRLTLTDTRLVMNTSAALNQSKDSGVSVLTVLERCVVTGNDNGLVSNGSGGPSYIRVSNTSITHNEGTALLAMNGGFILSRENNTFEENTTAGAFTGTYAAK